MTRLKGFYERVKKFVLERKIVSLIILSVLLYLIYRFFFVTTTAAVTTYNIDTVSRQTVVATLSETGQVSTDNSIEIKASVSGQITSLKVKAGDTVHADDLLATVESVNAYNTLRQAKLSYQSAKLSYQKSISPSATTTILSAQNSLANSSSSLLKAYSDSFDNITSAYSDMSSIISSLHDALYLSDLNSSQYNISYYTDNARAIENSYVLPNQADIFGNDAAAKYKNVKADYDAAFLSYQALARDSSQQEIYTAIQKASIISNELSTALKSAITLVQYYQDLFNKYSLTLNSKSTTYLINLKSYQNTINSDVSTLSSAKNNIDSLGMTIKQQTSNLNDLQNGVSGLDLDSAKLSLDQAELNYEVAQNNYSNYFITSPIDGVIASINTTVGSEASGNSVATIISKGKFANLSVSESDISKIKVGEKATLTFDAIDDFSVIGIVSQINQVGTVSSGVVSYNVKVSFDDTGDKVKSGMSVTAEIQTGVATDVLAVPNAAIKSNRSSSYVQRFGSMNELATSTNIAGFIAKINPKNVTITLGVEGIGYTEIKSGLNEGDIIVTKTLSSTAANTTSASKVSGTRSATSILGGMGGVRPN